MIYVASLGMGLAVGVAYGMIGLRSPAPPIAALLGLLGMLAGENAVAAFKTAKAQRSATSEPTSDTAQGPGRTDR